MAGSARPNKHKPLTVERHCASATMVCDMHVTMKG